MVRGLYIFFMVVVHIPRACYSSIDIIGVNNPPIDGGGCGGSTVVRGLYIFFMVVVHIPRACYSSIDIIGVNNPSIDGGGCGGSTLGACSMSLILGPGRFFAIFGIYGVKNWSTGGARS